MLLQGALACVVVRIVGGETFEAAVDPQILLWDNADLGFDQPIEALGIRCRANRWGSHRSGGWMTAR